ncbi:MAG: pyridoxal 5'-phosphate synthase glutaminase subunit PdxT [Dehalococcoidia bacterium]|nr:pyridoxal 5'-phosphate synthase glutaminase subunit PdxT [Dehalococcoidia bacterium]MDP6227662.1 pyridoxal 5'-phosphate synthase glutaminase subunit PdxT [Dehalococcoidia bacterium]MDP7084757.1 pyridoxal 5'-phosphate synthase glutaminase subunit PdxT [Dehalococcoidia bacterium]MDP7201560.1 pyridoxal 5'-phosphate synthase glutaminase subunit PdxT [Dehalococcoidia bacterium]MDP7511872.1 pyridoxal 5'-phosphate synthase glutaminase subunit PdxT [Dehalococcoidia bacterium]
MTVGVLALQGDFAEHIAILRSLGVEGREVRLPQHLEKVEGLIIPGGESTTLSRLMSIYGLREPVTRMAQQGKAIWGTCAGMIMMAHEITEQDPSPLGLMDIGVQRNAFGRQVDSFEQDLEIECFDHSPFHAVFIRAPVIQWVGESVKVLASLPTGLPVAVRQGNLLATAFHPELTGDNRFHRYFLDLVPDAAE